MKSALWVNLSCLLVAVALSVLMSGAAEAADLGETVTSVVVHPGGSAWWYDTETGVWNQIEKGQVLKPCTRVACKNATITTRRYTCSNKRRMVYIAYGEGSGLYFLYYHIKGLVEKKNTALPGWYIDVYHGGMRTVDGPGCEGTGHCGCYGIQGMGIPVTDGGAITDYRCIQDSVAGTTSFYNHPRSNGLLGTQALVGSDPAVYHLSPGEAIRFDDEGEISIPHVSLFVDPWNGFTYIEPGGHYELELCIVNPDTIDHMMNLSMSFEDPSGWLVETDSSTFDLLPGQDLVTTVTVEGPSAPKGEVNILYIGVDTDSGELTESSFFFEVGYPTLTIEKTHGTILGGHQIVNVTLEDNPVEMGGFDFMIAYDASALAFQAAIPGPAFYDPAPDGCGWEYFTYRHGPFGNCGDACPSGMVRVFGLAETNNGPNHPSCFLPDSLPATLFSLDFLVTNDRTFEGQYIPVKFFWTDCGDNTVSSVDGEVLYVSDHVYEFEGTEITDPTYGFPTYFGVQAECLNPDPDKPTALQFVDFINGGIDIIPDTAIDDRGDINLNGVDNEVADAVLFSNYFVHGISVFNVNIDGQIAASDVNADGISLSVADLVYLIRIITGDALPYPKLTAITANADLVNGVLSVDGEMGAAYVVVERSITPRLLVESMEMKYQYDADHDLTRILVYSMDKDQRFSGDFLGGIDGNVITLEMATYEGAPVTTKLVPDEFALYPSYPNPFNPVTTISFALASLVDYELVIYNSLGQTVKTFNGHFGPGLERIDWNASGFASGVYFYRLTAGDFTDTKKMVLLK